MRVFALTEQFCTLCNSETMLFVRYGKTEIFKLRFVGYKCVSADYKVDFSV